LNHSGLVPNIVLDDNEQQWFDLKCKLKNNWDNLRKAFNNNNLKKLSNNNTKLKRVYEWLGDTWAD